ncbi:MAG: sulfatase-like hydrolase/transferase [Kofleriaceae bacterium]
MAVPESSSVAARPRWRFARWLAASGAAAAAGAIAGGLVEAAGLDGLEITLTAAGFFALVVLPILLAGSVLIRAIYLAWQPRALLSSLTEDGGGSPRFTAWLVIGVLAALGLAWSLFQGTWMLAAATAFRPNTVSFAEPAIALVTIVVIVALSRPAVQLVAAGLRRIDRAWRVRGHRTLLRPRDVLAAIAVLTLVVGYVLWRVLIKKRLGPFDISVILAPAVAIMVTALVHAVWRWAPRARLAVGGVAGALAATAIALAIVATRNDASLTLEIWNARPIAGLAVDKLFDLDRIREHISLAQFRPVERPGAPHPDIVLVTIDTVRADHTPPYGGKAEMPVLRDLGARGSVFVWAFAPSNVTRRSIPSMVIGLQPNRIRGRVVGWALRVDPRHVLLAERLRAGGYETAGFMCCPGFWGPKAKTGLGRGLEHLQIVEDSGTRLAQTARAWLQARANRPGNRPLFLWMHILEPHGWTKGGADPRNDDERNRFYDRTLTASDRILGELLAGFTGRPPERAPITIVTADHGEALGEHGQPYHSTDLYNSQIHVPFVITGPGIATQRIAETVSLTDLTPTIVELAGFEPPAGASMDGRSLAALATGKRLPDPHAGTAFAAMIKDRSNPGGVTAIVRGGWKLIDTGVGIELYDLKADPFERQNLVGQQQALAAELRQLLATRQAAGALTPFQ